MTRMTALAAPLLLLILSSLQLTQAASLASLQKRQQADPAPPLPSASDPLECFQVAQPVLGPLGPVLADVVAPRGGEEDEEEGEEGKTDGVEEGGSKCEVVLMEHTFGWSYGLPFIGNYTPPPCDFNRVIMNFTVLSAGRQFDRLALMYIGDTEVWRTSTAEPRASGIIWTYWKDMTQYMYFWKEPQKIIFDLGNLIDDTYTGPFNTTLTATFFMDPESGSSVYGSEDEDVGADAEGGSGAEKAKRAEGAADGPADLIIPISARKGDMDEISAWNIPESDAVNVISDFPRNVRRAVFSISGNGQQAEEFWWSNLAESDKADFNQTAGMYYGLSPWREVQLLIDGQLAGVQWPFPVLFTGGVNPAFHRPIVGIDAFDLREHEIDVTPWLPLLCDGKDHEFRIQVAGIDDTVPGMNITDKVDNYWVITGKIFVWLDEEGAITTGDVPYASGDVQDVKAQIFKKLDKGDNGYNETLAFEIQTERDFSVRGKIVTSAGEQEVRWTQSLKYTNRGTVSSFGFDQYNDMTISGVDVSYGAAPYRSEYSYPLRVGSAYREDQQTGDFSINATMYQGLDLSISGTAVFPSGLEPYSGYDGSQLSTFRDGAAYLFRTGDGKSGYGYGNMDQEFSFQGKKGGGSSLLYSRKVSAVNDTVVSDEMVSGDKAGTFVAPENVVNELKRNGIAEYAVDPGYVKPLASHEGKFPAVEESAVDASGDPEVEKQWWLSWFLS